MLEGQTPLVDPAAFKDGLVFIGATAVGLKDVFAVPLGATGAMAGPHIHANVADMILSGRVMHRLSPWLCVLLALLVSVGARCAVMPARVTLGLAGAAALLGVAYLGGLQAFGRGLWVPLVPATLGWVLATGGGFAYQYVVEGREKRQVRSLFSRYLSKDVYDQVLANPSLAELGGKRRHMSVLFSDMRGFTTLSERGDPEALVQQLNEYFSRMVDVVFDNRGTLDKFVGDMVMALFGAPLDDEDHAEHAVATAVAMVTALEDLNRGWAARGTADAGHRHRRELRRDDRRDHRLAAGPQLYGDRRRREPRRAAGVAEQGVPDVDHHQRRHAEAAAHAPDAAAAGECGSEGQERRGRYLRGRRR